ALTLHPREGSDADGQPDRSGLRARGSLSASPRASDARRLGAVAASEGARVGPADRYPVGTTPARAVPARSDPRGEDVLEPTHLGRVRRHRRESGAPPPLLSGEPASRPPLLLHDADHGGRAARGGLVADGRAAGRLLPAAAESPDRGCG